MREDSEVGMFTNPGRNSRERRTAMQGAILGNVETYEVRNIRGKT